MKKIISVTFSVVLMLVVGNYFLWQMEKTTDAATKQQTEVSFSEQGLVSEDYTVDKLNSQVSVKQLRKLVLQDEQIMLQEEQTSTPQEKDDYDLNQLNEEISSLQQYLNKEE
ncbi:hypothetical protein [Photobacterium sp. 53610]|uniref:hypothetical protein n=1 Tax=Photobacterium sp. 53610 TaxID=3102789 RepID=UPI002ED860CE